MKTSTILIMLAFIMLLKGMTEPLNEKYIISGCLIGLIGWFIYLVNEKDKKSK